MRSKLFFLMAALLILFGMNAATPTQAAPSAATAGQLRATLVVLLTEHVALASSATGNALGGRDAGFKAAADALDGNSVDLSKAVASIYGQGAGDAFLPLWRKHIGFFVDYTLGVAAKDKAKQDKAVNDLVAYTQEFGAFLNSANPNLPKNAVADLVKMHVLTLKDVVDAQAAGDNVKQFTALRQAYAHMDMIGSALAGGIAKQFPDKFTGKADSAGAGLRTTLNWALTEHTYLAARATGAALGGRTDEFNAAAAALDGNSVDLSKAVASIYGQGAGDAFLPLWRKHIGFFVDYTQGLAAKDKAKQDKAINDLLAYTQEFGAFLASANPNLPKDAVADLVKMHALTLKDVIDAQGANDQPKVYSALRTAFGHMPMIANPLADAIIKQFPAKFSEAPVTVPQTGGESVADSLYVFMLLSLAIVLFTVSYVLKTSMRRTQ
ncbi:MAG: copper amine oxidase N-terminal domain-containing protein [Chloroflexota bacterium]